VFLNTERKIYATWQEASVAAQRLGIKTMDEYVLRFREDPRLYSTPQTFYKDFPGHRIFLGKTFYPTWEDASRVAQKLGARTKREYESVFKKDSRLMMRPDKFYSDFPGWKIFLGTGTEKRRMGEMIYPTWKEASHAVRNKGITTKPEYMVRYKEDPRLPSNPNRVYKNFPGWKIFLGKE